MCSHECGERRRPQQWGIARQDYEISLFEVDTLFETSQRDRGSVSSSKRLDLFDELDTKLRRRIGLHRLHHFSGAVADNNDDAFDRKFGKCVEHVEKHRTATEAMKGLWRRRVHPRPLPGGEDDGGKGATGHGSIILSEDDPPPRDTKGL